MVSADVFLLPKRGLDPTRSSEARFWRDKLERRPELKDLEQAVWKQKELVSALKENNGAFKEKYSNEEHFSQMRREAASCMESDPISEEIQEPTESAESEKQYGTSEQEVEGGTGMLEFITELESPLDAASLDGDENMDSVPSPVEERPVERATSTMKSATPGGKSDATTSHNIAVTAQQAESAEAAAGTDSEVEQCASESDKIKNPDLFVPKRGAYSQVWAYFGFKPDDDTQQTIYCKQCLAVVCAPKGNTTNLFNHLKPNHIQEYETVGKKNTAQSQSTCKHTKQTSIKGTFFNATPYPTNSLRCKEITEAITFHLAKDMAPMTTVEKEGFKKLIQTLNKRFQLPSRTYFSHVAIPGLYVKCRERVATELQDIVNFAATSDLWSSRAMEPYMSLTIHFINDDFEMTSRCLQTGFFPEDHTGEALAQGLKNALINWKLEEKNLVCITTDNGSNIVKAISINHWTRLQCFGHRLHLAIENAMKDPRIERAMDHKLKTESPTRWGSRQAMVRRILEQQAAITHVLSSDRKARHLLPTWQDLEILEAVDKTLTPLADFTDALSGEQYVSVSSVKPALHLFQSSVLAVKEDDSDLICTMKSKIMGYLEEKYQDQKTQDLLDIATTLDPRFKMTYVNENNKTAVQNRLKEEMSKLTTVKESPPTTPSGQCHAKKARKSLGSFFKSASEGAPDPALGSHQQQSESLSLELHSYLFLGNTDSEDDPLVWWKTHKEQYPRLSALARKYLCIPATSSPSERVFSTGGNIVTCRCSALKPQNVDRLVFLAKNL
ncbi:E3 SUMO-protein ligase ZBED1-like [Lithobates pipiens]